MSIKLMRSKLFVPGARPELFAKALAGNADALSFDLEDSVAQERKAEARTLVCALLRSDAIRDTTKRIIVRVNAPGTLYFEDDVNGLASSRVGMINLPKIETAADLVAVAGLLDRVEAANQIERPIELLVNIETAKALRNAPAIACAHRRVVGLQLGLGDLFESSGIDRRNPDNVHAAMFAVRMAAAEAGVFALDGAFARIDDAPGFEAEASVARGLGYQGKSCIHPRQVDLANRVFAFSEDEIQAARRIVNAAQAAAKAGRGAFAVDGHMIDGPFLERAEAILAASGPYGAGE